MKYLLLAFAILLVGCSNPLAPSTPQHPIDPARGCPQSAPHCPE